MSQAQTNTTGTTFSDTKAVADSISVTDSVVTTTPVVEELNSVDYYERAVEKVGNGDDEGALQDLDKSLELNGRWKKAYALRAEINQKLKRYEPAAADYSKAIEWDKGFEYMFYFNRAECYKMSGELQKALSDYDAIARYVPKDRYVYYNRGVLKLKLEDTEGACADFKKALSLGNSYAKELLEANCK